MRDVLKIAAAVALLSRRERGNRFRSVLADLAARHFVLAAVLVLFKLDSDGLARVWKLRLAEDLKLPVEGARGVLLDLAACGILAIADEGPEFIVVTLSLIASRADRINSRRSRGPAKLNCTSYNFKSSEIAR